MQGIARMDTFCGHLIAISGSCDWAKVRPMGRNVCYDIVQQPSRHFPLNLAKIPPNQVIADFGRGSSV